MSEIVVALVGLQLTRKASLVERARRRHYSVVSVGEYLRRLIVQKGWEPTATVSAALSREMLSDGEPILLEDVLAQATVDEHSPRFIVDSIKTLPGALYLRRRFPSCAIVACVASPEQRWRAARHRGRSDAPDTFREFCERDYRELSLGVGLVALGADYFFSPPEDELVAVQLADRIFDAIETIGGTEDRADTAREWTELVVRTSPAGMPGPVL